ncbi:hypothetical protein EG834_09890 [bacterium]|nr:hypothetical protein [bacterium]
MPGRIEGLEWRGGVTPRLITALPLPANATEPASPLWNTVLTTNPQPPNGRFGVVALQDVSAPFAYLHDTADESFAALRENVARECGWDFLANLENAYTPFNEPPTPNMDENWLFTGRAISLNGMPLNAGWMALVREEFNGQTFWRVYLRARYQDGSQGIPLRDNTWDMNARFLGSPQDFEAGGRNRGIPAGYWINFSEIAARYGWERSPALTNWRTYLPAARYNLYRFSEGLDWYTAMSEVYPAEALTTPTFRPTFTPTITLTPDYFDLITLTPTPLPSLTPTIRPTLTPQP